MDHGYGLMGEGTGGLSLLHPQGMRFQGLERDGPAPQARVLRGIPPRTQTGNYATAQSALESSRSGQNQLYYGGNLEVLRQHIKDESVDLIYLDPPFNSRQDYNVLFAE
jgi:hypothetical protein